MRSGKPSHRYHACGRLFGVHDGPD